MKTFLEFLREVLKGIMREVSAYFFRKNILEHKKTTLRGHIFVLHFKYLRVIDLNCLLIKCTYRFNFLIFSNCFTVGVRLTKKYVSRNLRDESLFLK